MAFGVLYVLVMIASAILAAVAAVVILVLLFLRRLRWLALCAIAAGLGGAVISMAGFSALLALMHEPAWDALATNWGWWAAAGFGWAATAVLLVCGIGAALVALVQRRRTVRSSRQSVYALRP